MLDSLAFLWPDVAMKRVGIAELKNNLSRHLREVEGGASLEITDHDRPVAHVVPVRRRSRLVIKEPMRAFAEVAVRTYQRLDLPISSTELLRRDRDTR